MNALITLWLGGILFGIGFLHLRGKINRADAKSFLTGHIFLREKIGVSLFQRLWFLGRTPFALFCLGGLIVLDWRAGVIAGGIFGLAAGLEVTVKRLVGRPRPFKLSPVGADMLQPQPPTDPSFPSGDSFRVWFLALLIPAFWGAPWYAYLVSGGVASLVTLGRLAMGVHYPLDTIAGTGLGLTSASSTILIWQVAGLLTV